MKLSAALSFLLAASFNNLEECTAASSSDFTTTDSEEAGTLRGANNNKNMITTERELEGRHRWSPHCGSGKTHEEKCGGSRPDCCDVRLKDDYRNISFLECKKKTEGSDNKRCHEIHSNDIKWEMLCHEWSLWKTKDETCGGLFNDKCCEYVAHFEDYKVSLKCSENKCVEVTTRPRHDWSQLCSGGRIWGEQCGGDYGGCCTALTKDEVGNFSKLECKKTNPRDNDIMRCEEIKSDDIDWHALCETNGKEEGENCGGSFGECCSTVATFGRDYKVSLGCDMSSGGKCKEVQSAFSFDNVHECTIGQNTETCAVGVKGCCPYVADFGSYTLSLECTSPEPPSWQDTCAEVKTYEIL